MMIDWVGSFDFLRGNVAALVVATAVFILVVPDVRLALPGLDVAHQFVRSIASIAGDNGSNRFGFI